MGKRITIISVVILISGITFLGYFLHQSRKSLFTDPYKIIAPDACVIIETVDIRSLINSLTTGKGLFSEIEKINEFRGFDTKLKYISDQVNKPGFKKFINEGTALISFHPALNTNPEPFLSMTLPAGVGPRQLRETLVSFGVRSIYEEKVNGKRLFILPFNINNKKDTLFVCMSSGLLISSTSYRLIYNAISQQQPGIDIRNTPGFLKVLHATGKNEDKIYIVFNNLPNVLRSLFSPQFPSMADKIDNLGDCAGGDLYIGEEGFSISGYIETSDPADFLYRYKNIAPRELKTYRVLPAAAGIFETMLIEERPSKVADANLTLAQRLKPYLGNEITRAYIDIKTMPVKENSIVVVELKNPVQCEQIIREVFEKTLEIKYFRPDDQLKIPIYYTGQTGLISQLAPNLAPAFSDSYFAFFDNYMVTGNSETTLSRFLYDNILNKTLANDILYHEFEKLVPSRSAYLFYCNPSRVVDYLAYYFSPEIINGFRSNRMSLGKIQSVGFQMASINEMIYTNLSVRYKDQIMEESETEWETLLDTTACIKPFFFKNHISGAREIFIQDLNNNAYLINAAGRVLWKIPLRERIKSTVYMIDFYRNGKYQLLFAGKNYIHVIDRNGNYVERYPVKLRSPATNSIALFDYDNNQTYRLVIAGEDKLIYSYDKSGNIVKGWNPFRTAGYVTTEANFYRISGKDFIVIADESTLYFLDRSGNVRLNLKDAVTRAGGSAVRLITGSNPSLVCTSPEGVVQNIYFDGEVRKFNLRSFSFDHSFDFFDIDGDGIGEYIFIDKGILYLYDHDRSEMFSKDFSSERLGGPITFIFSSNDRKIGVFDIDRNLIYLIGKKGEVMKGFPLKGASMFSIGKLTNGNEWNLIVGGTDRFLYNYKLDTSNR